MRTPVPPVEAAEPASYHHGALRDSLVAAALELIAEHGLARLSLRECARRAGVSHAAPYRHFADKDALLQEIARRGFEQLADAGEAAVARHREPRARLDAYGVVYARFALERPVLFRVMFTSEAGTTLEPAAGGDRSFRLLTELAQAVTGETPQELTGALAAWSLVHGLAMLLLDGRIPRASVQGPKGVDRLVEGVFETWRQRL